MTDETAAPEAAQPAGAIISGAVREAIRLVSRDPDTGLALATGDDVVHGLVDALAITIARSPYTDTMRGRRTYVDEIRDALLHQTALYQDAISKGADLIVPLKAPVQLRAIDGGKPAGRKSSLILPPGHGGDAA